MNLTSPFLPTLLGIGLLVSSPLLIGSLFLPGALSLRHFARFPIEPFSCAGTALLPRHMVNCFAMKITRGLVLLTVVLLPAFGTCAAALLAIDTVVTLGTH
jgi:hypothetical protein